MVPFVTGC